MPLLASFEASLRDLHDGHMPQISSIPISYEEIQTAKKNHQYDPVEEAGEPEIAQQVPAEANDDSEPAWGIADIVDITDEQGAQRGDILSPKMGNIGQDALCQLNLDLVKSSPLHFDLTKRGNTEANILEVQESDGVENENLKIIFSETPPKTTTL